MQNLLNPKNDPLADYSLKDYSLSRAISCAISKRNEGLEGYFHEALGRMWNLPEKPSGFLVPLKALAASTATTGGFTIGNVIPSVSDALRPSSIALSAGAQLIELRPDARIPRFGTGATAFWLSEMEACPESSANLQAVNLSPRRCAAWIKISNQLLAQVPSIADQVFSRDLRSAIGSALDLGIFSGVGGHEPVGLLNSSDVQTVTFGASPTRSKLSDFEKSLGTENAADTAAVWVTSPTARKKWRNTLNDAVAGAGYLWADSDTVLGRPARSSNNVADDRAILGDFSDLMIVSWGVIEISDVYTSKKTAQTELYVQLLADAAPTRGKSFVVSTDSAAQ